MAATNINRVVLTGNLTRDPELRSTASGMSVCSLRIASNTRRKNQSTGEWEDKPNFFDVTVWGAQGENCARFLSKGRPVALDGRLEWREWETQDGNKRQSVEIVADAVQFLGGRDDGNGGGGGGFTPRSDVPVNESDFQPAGGAARARAAPPRPTTTSPSRPAQRAPGPAGRPRPPSRYPLWSPCSGRWFSLRDARQQISRHQERVPSGEAAQPADAPA